MNIRLFVANLLALIIIMSMSGCSTTKSTQKILGHENLIIYYDPQGGNGELIEAAKNMALMSCMFIKISTVLP